MARKVKKVDYSVSTKDEICKQVGQLWPDFKRVPEDEKWPVALYMLGANIDQIAAQTGLTPAFVGRMLGNYDSLIVSVPPALKCDINVMMIWRSIGVLASVATDEDKLKKLSPEAATDLMKKQMPLLKDFVEIGKIMGEHKNSDKTLSEGLSELGRRLGSGESDASK